jgi:hypothetical protein
MRLYIFSTLNDRGLPLSDADSDPIDIKLKRERGNQTQNKKHIKHSMNKTIKSNLEIRIQ